MVLLMPGWSDQGANVCTDRDGRALVRQRWENWMCVVAKTDRAVPTHEVRLIIPLNTHTHQHSDHVQCVEQIFWHDGQTKGRLLSLSWILPVLGWALNRMILLCSNGTIGKPQPLLESVIPLPKPPKNSLHDWKTNTKLSEGGESQTSRFLGFLSCGKEENK